MGCGLRECGSCPAAAAASGWGKKGHLSNGPGSAPP
uniref:Uncharacterized protein n=1 Tax=Setaria italica TaxID=4555 RepID=K3ZPL1_SETIT